MQKCYNKKNVAYFNRATKTKQTRLAMMERRDTVEADFPGDFADSRSLSLWVTILWKDTLLGDLNGWATGFIFVTGRRLLKSFDLFLTRVKLAYAMASGSIVIVFLEFLYFFLATRTM